MNTFSLLTCGIVVYVTSAIMNINDKFMNISWSPKTSLPSSLRRGPKDPKFWNPGYISPVRVTKLTVCGGSNLFRTLVYLISTCIIFPCDNSLIILPHRQSGTKAYDCYKLRYGFNSHGHSVVEKRLEEQFLKRGHPQGILGINLGKNKTSENAVMDYVKGVYLFSGWGDYLVINVSSPNTPGLRALQGRESLAQLIDKVRKMGGQADSQVRSQLHASCKKS